VVVAEFLRRGYNAGIPEVDRGDDIFVVEDTTGRMWRIQVKAANGKGKIRQYAQYHLDLIQLRKVHFPELYYVFALHSDERWSDFLVIPRATLWRLRNRHGLGNAKKNDLFIRFSFSTHDVLCKGINFQRFRNNWTAWPVLQH
jgi:hypothetical protein